VWPCTTGAYEVRYSTEMAYLEYRPTKPLFHYTSEAGFHGILTSKQLWLSNIERLNDPRELTFGYDNVFKALYAAKEIADDPNTKRLVEFMEKRIRPYRENSSVYCCCFTYNCDSLPMWQSYADGGRGISIGFRPTALMGIPARIQKVRYMSGDTKRYLGNLVISLARDFDNPSDIAAQIEVASKSFSAMVALKHGSWAYEEEIRLTHAQRNLGPQTGEPDFAKYKGVDRFGQPVPWGEPLVRRTPSGEVPYFSFPFGRQTRSGFDARGAIEKFIVGPRCEMTVDQVKEAVTGYGFSNFVVQQSDCLIR
jgi:hypothetical protein